MMRQIPVRNLATAALASIASAASAYDSESNALAQGMATCANEDAPVWRQFLDKSIEKEKGDPTSKFLTLATVKGSEPRARTVVFRGFLDDEKNPNILKFITDLRSEKIGEIDANAKAEAMWYFLDTR